MTPPSVDLSGVRYLRFLGRGPTYLQPYLREGTPTDDPAWTELTKGNEATRLFTVRCTCGMEGQFALQVAGLAKWRTTSTVYAICQACRSRIEVFDASLHGWEAEGPPENYQCSLCDGDTFSICVGFEYREPRVITSCDPPEIHFDIHGDDDAGWIWTTVGCQQCGERLLLQDIEIDSLLEAVPVGEWPPLVTDLARYEPVY